MTEGHRHRFTDPGRQRRITYLVVGIVLVVLLVIGFAAYRSGRLNPEANRKADQLIGALNQAGISAPAKGQILRTLGDDGGAVCADPGAALKKAIRDGLGSNGAAGPGMRPVYIAERAVQGELLVIQIYCPDELPAFQRYVDGLNTDDVIKE